MKTLSPSALVGKRASIRSVLLAAGAHNWSREAINDHMDRERLRYRPNWLWHVDRFLALFSGKKNRIELVFDGAFTSVSMLALFSTLAFFWILFLAWTDLFFMNNLFGPHWQRGLMPAMYASALGIGVSVALLLLLSGLAHIFLVGAEVVSPARWETARVSEHNLRDAALGEPQRALMKQILTLLPGTTFEASKLYQDKRVLDPVLWAVVPVPGGSERHAVMVWDGDVITYPPE